MLYARAHSVLDRFFIFSLIGYNLSPDYCYYCFPFLFCFFVQRRALDDLVLPSQHPVELTM